ncbi:hypothetical protein DPSP01_006344 [Paraphaeosphaeria sporulosa]|uniref:Cytochrome P450 n=1 Tax=Paraphaeosphaeria sporulosa TaxID=1460663 RepID=A0A177CG84_9PLEO|nr:uncharacterized protein CC84DRAFT_1196059 [Paraphaeosphaeria sporulosa]OAG05707.1 hypothetical protein CC84DRAFT_1196059 [Paraphaeosphaeria sporulosa]
MGSLKGLFLGVYASNSVIRTLFLPLCYLLLSSPFLLVFARYYGFDSRLFEFIGKDKSVKEIALQVFVGLIAATLPTRILSGKNWNSYQNGGTRRVQQIPYWIPQVRHWGSVVFGGEGWLKKVRDSALAPVVAFNIGGAKHNVVLSPALLEQVQKDPTGLDKLDITEWSVLRNAFNLPNDTEMGYHDLRPKLKDALDDNIFKAQTAEKLISASLSVLSDSLPDLVTFNTSIVDQLPWERVANLELTDGTIEAECDFFTLINEYFCSAIVAPITGAQFPESYELLASDLSTVTECYYALALGLPRLFPKPGLPGAMLAKKRLFQKFVQFFYDLDNPKKRVPDDDESMSGEETDAETPTPLTRMNEFFSKNDIPLEARAAITIQLLHALVSEVVPLAFWTLLHLHTSVAAQPKTHKADTLIDEIRKETQIWALATQPPSIHPAFPAPPAISFSGLPRLVSPTSFPHLRSAINEARRLYKAPITTLKTNKPITLTEVESIRPGVQEKWELDAGSYIAIGLSQSLINTSAAHFIAPAEYRPDRFYHTAPPLSITSHSDPQESLTTSLLIAFVAGILQLWEIAPAPKKSFMDHMQEAQAAAMGPVDGKAQSAAQSGVQKKVGRWVVPRAVDGASVKIPKGDVRVRIRRREGLPEQRLLRKGK